MASSLQPAVAVVGYPRTLPRPSFAEALEHGYVLEWADSFQEAAGLVIDRGMCDFVLIHSAGQERHALEFCRQVKAFKPEVAVACVGNARCHDCPASYPAGFSLLEALDQVLHHARA